VKSIRLNTLPALTALALFATLGCPRQEEAPPPDPWQWTPVYSQVLSLGMELPLGKVEPRAESETSEFQLVMSPRRTKDGEKAEGGVWLFVQRIGGFAARFNPQGKASLEVLASLRVSELEKNGAAFARMKVEKVSQSPWIWLQSFRVKFPADSQGLPFTYPSSLRSAARRGEALDFLIYYLFLGDDLIILQAVLRDGEGTGPELRQALDRTALSMRREKREEDRDFSSLIPEEQGEIYLPAPLTSA